MLVTVFQNRPHVCFPPVLVVLHLLGGKQNLKHNLIHAVKVSLRHFMPFVRGARCFSHWFFIAFSSSFCWSVGQEGSVSVMIAAPSGLRGWKSCQCWGFGDAGEKRSSLSAKTPLPAGPFRHRTFQDKWMKASCPVPLTCKWTLWWFPR